MLEVTIVNLVLSLSLSLSLFFLPNLKVCRVPQRGDIKESYLEELGHLGAGGSSTQGADQLQALLVEGLQTRVESAYPVIYFLHV